MKKIQLLLLFVTCLLQAIAQNKTVTQLKKELAEHPQQDPLRVDRLNDLSFNVFFVWDERRKFMEEALSISQKINYTRGEAYALASLGYYKSLGGHVHEADSLMKRAESLAEKIEDPNLSGVLFYRTGLKKINLGDREGLDNLFKAEKIFETSNNYDMLTRCHASIASAYQLNYSNYPGAMEYLVKARQSAEKANSRDINFMVLNNWATLYQLMGDYENALVYLNKSAEEIKRAEADIGKTQLLNNMGEIYRLTGKYPEAIDAYTRARQADSSMFNADVYESNLADVYTRMNNLPLAFQYAFSSLAIAKKIQDDYILGWLYGVFARAYVKKGDGDSAIFYGRQGLDIASKTGSIEFMRDNAQALADAYAHEKDFANAYKYHMQYINFRDSMLNTEVGNRAAVLKYSNDLDKKQAQIVQLSQQKKIQKAFLSIAVIGLALILITAGLLLRNNRQKQKANKLLRRQKQEIDAKAKDLEQSYNNVELLGDIGRRVTSSLSVETIISTVYDSVNSLMDASVFGIGIYHEDTHQIDFPATYENGVALPAYTNSIYEENRFASLCFISGKEVVIGDLATEYKNYLQNMPTPKQGNQPASLIYLPLKAKEKIFGVITVQSFQRDAFSDYHLYMLRTIALYAAIALENAESYKKLNQTVDSLTKTQSQLIHSEKMASLGELTAGIAHEIQNPLNFVNNFSEVNVELIEELSELLETGDLQAVNETFEDIKKNLEKISLHGRRADSIVKGMLQHSQSSTGAKEQVDINALTDEYLRLAYHGLRAKDKSFNAITKTEFDHRIEKINVVPQDIGRVLLNLINNAYYTVNEKKKVNQNGYEPVVTVTTVQDEGKVKIKVRDNGNGIPPKILDKIFQPFFTTKPTGQGTGLGLSLAYDIVKAHGGEIKVETRENEGTEFTMVLAA
ncbi:MAG TPA: ATP-binding protein [Chitinophagaceae bacterium]|jgi:C4-dicarboxylate-specific signal transduction histidine kinase/tetratricopeptide (TPR) repeat protein|nr:ATP-binding protein [Chitinophagaceae bacterium]